MTFVSYAQNFEDVLLWRLLHDVERGQYLDIGAQDPVFDSVSLAFYNAGWRGLHVEPTPAYAARLREARPDETVIEAAITSSEGPIEFYEIPETGLSTGKAEIAERHRESGFEKRTILVPCMRLDSLFETMSGDVHWMKVDVEGMEAEVLKSWGDHQRRPWVLLIEATFPNTQEHCEHLWIEEVLRRGYREAHFDGLSRYFIHEDHDELISRLEAPANLFDAFHVTSTHFTAGMLNENSNTEMERVRSESKERESQLAQEISGLRDEIGGLGQALEAASAATGEAEAQRLVLAETLAASEREYRHAIDLIWRERQEEETRLRERWSEIEQRLRDQIASADIQLHKDAIELAALRERTTQQQGRIERIRAEAEAAGKQVALLNKEISALQRSSREQREQAAAQINERDQQLGHINRVIYNALAEPLGSWQRLGRALALFREDGARRLLRSWYANSSQPAASQVETNMLVPSGEARNPYLRANSLPELLAWDDLDFIRCAYVTILGRQPDPTGEAHYAVRLRAGRSKHEILWQLRKSGEGRQHDPGIAGLDRALKKARWQRLTPFRRSAAVPTRSDFARAPETEGALLRMEQRFASIEGKIDGVQRSLTFLEGAALREIEEKPESTSKLSSDSFRKNLASIANKIERNQK